MSGRWNSDNRYHYWGAMQGTSMACPFVTGTIGLWLQADPTLTYGGIIDVLEHTAETNANTQLEPDRWGYGLILTCTDGTLDVYVAGVTTLAVTICDIQGRIVASAKAAGNRLILNDSGLASGVYIVRVSGNTSTFTRKLTI